MSRHLLFSVVVLGWACGCARPPEDAEVAAALQGGIVRAGDGRVVSPPIGDAGGGGPRPPDAALPLPPDAGVTPLADAAVPTEDAGDAGDAGDAHDAGGDAPDAGDLCAYVVCAEWDQCYDSECDPATGWCVPTPKLDGTACDDGVECTIGETCQSGSCTGGERDHENPDCCQCECEQCPEYCGCLPATCEDVKADCGTITDGCGGTVECGECESPEWCGGAGVENQCGCTPVTCELLGFDCGVVDDGCGGTLDCGTCSQGMTCGGTSDRAPHVCGCTPVNQCPPSGTGCGYAPDGCGSYTYCGECWGGTTCDANNLCACNSPGCLTQDPEPIADVMCDGADPDNPLCCNESNGYDCYGPWYLPEGESYLPPDPGTDTELPPTGGVETGECGPGCFSHWEESP